PSAPKRSLRCDRRAAAARATAAPVPIHTPASRSAAPGGQIRRTIARIVARMPPSEVKTDRAMGMAPDDCNAVVSTSPMALAPTARKITSWTANARQALTSCPAPRYHGSHNDPISTAPQTPTAQSRGATLLKFTWRRLALGGYAGCRLLEARGLQR